MNENAVEWVKRIPLRSALGGVVIGVVGTLLLCVRMLWYRGDEPVVEMAIFLGVILTFCIVLVTFMVGLFERMYLSRLKGVDDVEAASSVRTLPLKYAVVGLVLGLVLAGSDYRELQRMLGYEFALLAVALAAVSIAAIGLLLGLRSRSALQQRLSPNAASTVPQAVPKDGPVTGATAGTRRFVNVWFATRDTIESAIKLKMFNDSGALEVAVDSLRFSGRKQTLVIRDVADFRLVSQRPNWLAIVIVFAGMAMLAVLAGYLQPGRSLMVDLLVLAAAAVFGIYANSRVRWVRVSYRGDDGAAHEAYFTDGSSYGWGGITGGTRKLFDKLNTMTHAAAA